MEFDFKILLTLAISAVAPAPGIQIVLAEFWNIEKSVYFCIKNRNVVIFFNLKFHLVFIIQHRNRPWIFFMLSVWSVLFLSVACLSLLYFSLYLIWGEKSLQLYTLRKLFTMVGDLPINTNLLFPLISMNWGLPCARHCGNPQVDIKKIQKATSLFSRSLYQNGEGWSEINK